MAAFIPLGPSVSTTFVPRERSRCRRSTVMVSGIVKMQRNPRDAATYARPMPVFPLVGSTMIIPSRSTPRAMASSIIAAPIRSFTELYGLYPSCFTTIRPGSPFPSRLSRMSGVLPIVSVTSW
jgi:hypothetical protein